MTTPRGPHSRGRRSLIDCRQIGVFFLLAFIVSWYPWYAGLGAEVLAVGPSVAAFAIVLSVNGRSGLADLLRPFLHWRVGLGWWAIAVFGAALLYIVGLGASLAFGGEIPPFTMIREEAHLLPIYLFAVVLAPWNGPVGEEFGWRGFALPRMLANYGPLVASLMIGTAWGIWHLPTFFAPTGVLAALFTHFGIAFIVPYTVTTIANSIIMTWLYNRTGGSGLVAGIVWHAATNFWAPILLSDSSLAAARDGTHLPTIQPHLYLSVAGVLAASAVGLVIGTRGRLGLEPST